MNKDTIANQKTTLEKVSEQFKQWRTNRAKRGCIPQHLWHAAEELAKEHSLSKVAKTLCLSHTELKRRVHSKQPSKGIISIAKSSFIEVDAEAIISPEHTVEIEDTKGAKLKIYSVGSCELSGLIRTFLTQK
jgi:hypothetical protein